jgi:laccase
MYLLLIALCVVFWGLNIGLNLVQALLASQALTRSAKKDGETHLDKLAENLRLVMVNQKLKEQNKVLEDLRVLLNNRVDSLTKKADDQEKVIHKMRKTIDQNDQVLENLRSTVEKDAAKINILEADSKQFKADNTKKDLSNEKLLKEAEENRGLMDEAIGEIVEKSDQIYLEYKKALATFGAEPEPLPQDPKGGAMGLLNWILKEFASLTNILSMAFDNSVVISCESILEILDHEGCQDLSCLSSSDYIFPMYSDLGQNISDIQVMKKAFI